MPDSLDMVDSVMAFQDRIKTRIPEKKISKLNNLQPTASERLIDFIKKNSKQVISALAISQYLNQMRPSLNLSLSKRFVKLALEVFTKRSFFNIRSNVQKTVL